MADYLKSVDEVVTGTNEGVFTLTYAGLARAVQSLDVFGGSRHEVMGVVPSTRTEIHPYHTAAERAAIVAALGRAQEERGGKRG